MSFRRVVVIAIALAGGTAMAQAAAQSATATSTAGATSVAAASSTPASAGSTPVGAASSPAAAASVKPTAANVTEVGPLSGDVDAGKTKSATCGACHGADGNSTNPQYPKLAGQNEHYIVNQLKKFKDGQRKNAIMRGMASSLSVKDMHDIGAYFASQKVKPGVADKDLAGPGGKLFRAGDADQGTPACMSCHGPDGHGNPGAPYPQLAGQHAEYVQKVLTAWHDGETWGDSDHDKIMPSIAKKLSKKDIAELASYLQGLHTASSAEPPSP